MIKKLLNSLPFSIVFLMFICSIKAEEKRGVQKTLVIFQTSDIHSHIEGDSASWLNMAQMIQKERKNLPPNTASLLIDCGDTLPGSLIGVISQGEAAISILNTLKYDAWIVGNHDLEFGFDRLDALVQKYSVPTFAANLHPDNKNNFINWKLYKKKGIKIALIGLTSPHISEWLWGSKLKGYKISSCFNTIDAVMPELLKTSPDIIILAIHHGRFTPARLHGINIKDIADKYPQINLILGAHSHQEIPGVKCGLKTWYVETGAHAEKFARIDVLITGQQNPEVKIFSKLIQVKKQKAINPEIENSIQPWQQSSAKFAKQIIGYTKKEINSTRENTSSSDTSILFAKAIMEKSNAVAAFHGTIIESAKFAGNITEQNLFDAIPYEDTVCTLDLTPEELGIILNEQKNLTYKQNAQSLAGLIIPKDDNTKTSIRMSDGSRLETGKRYKCAFSSYALAGAGGRFPKLKAIASRPTSNGIDTEITVREAVREYIRKNYPPPAKSSR